MDQFRFLIYAIGAFVVLFFMWISLRKPMPVQLPTVESDQNNLNSDSSVASTAAHAQRKEPAVSFNQQALSDHAEEGGGSTMRSAETLSLYDENLMVMNIFAPSGFAFAGEDIFSVLESSGLVYQDGLFAHLDSQGAVYFKVASAVGDGFFSTDNLAELKTTGLTCYMELKALVNPRAAFRTMLTDAHELSYTLGGQLKDEMGQPLSQQSVTGYLAKIKALDGSREMAHA